MTHRGVDPGLTSLSVETHVYGAWPHALYTSRFGIQRSHVLLFGRQAATDALTQGLMSRVPRSLAPLDGSFSRTASRRATTRAQHSTRWLNSPDVNTQSIAAIWLLTSGDNKRDNFFSRLNQTSFGRSLGDPRAKERDNGDRPTCFGNRKARL